jgi:hypothetical protein
MTYEISGAEWDADVDADLRLEIRGDGVTVTTPITTITQRDDAGNPVGSEQRAFARSADVRAVFGGKWAEAGEKERVSAAREWLRKQLAAATTVEPLLIGE